MTSAGSYCRTSIRCLSGGTLVLILLALAACEPPPGPAAGVAQPEGWADELALTVPVDINPDPNIVEIEFDARLAEIEFLPGRKTPAWTYGGSVPGPLIRAKVGDRVIVHFTNRLPEATSIHWHGLRVPNEMDGVPGVNQDPVAPDETFRYEFVVRDAGTYWYHPHINSAAQVGWGMYGPILVEDPAEVLIATETDRGLFIAAMIAASVAPIPPGVGARLPSACPPRKTRATA